MRNTRLILIEGIPGSGKSTMAQVIASHLKREGTLCAWWYEENKDHPVYVFRDLDSLHEVVGQLQNRRFPELVESALKRWAEFAELVSSTESPTIIDGCLFGYLSWSLFPHDADAELILDYITQVERILQACNTCLIHLYQSHVEAALRKICDRRGGDAETSFIESATQSAYGKRHQLSGFSGLVSYWSAYREVIDTAFAGLSMPKLAIETSQGDWRYYQQQVLSFLEIAESNDDSAADSLHRFVGVYQGADVESRQVECTVRLQDGGLVVDGLPQVWRETPLLPVSSTVFDVQSLPFQVTFSIESGLKRLRLTGPEQLSGPVNVELVAVD